MDEFESATFPPPKRTDAAKLYLISPQDVGGIFPDRLKAALGAGPVHFSDLIRQIALSPAFRQRRAGGAP